MANVLRYLGLGAETEYGTEAAHDVMVDIASASLDVPDDPQIRYEGGLGKVTRVSRPGYYAPAGDFSYAFDIRTIVDLLHWTLGTRDGDEVYGSLDAILPSFTAKLGKDLFEHVFTGCTITSLGLSVEGAFCEATASVLAQKDAKANIRTIEDVVDALPDEYPMAFHEVKLEVADVGGANPSDFSARVRSMSMNIDNGVSADGGRGLNSRYMYKAISESRDTTVDLTLDYEDLTMLEAFWGSENGPSDDGADSKQFKITLDSGIYGELVILLPKVTIVGSQQQPSGRSRLEQTVNGIATLDSVEKADLSIVETEMFVDASGVISVS